MADTLEIFGVEYPNAAGIKATDDNDTLLSFIRPTGTKSITNNGSNIDVTEYAAVNVNVSSSVNLQSKSKSYTPTESAQSETVTADNGYDGLSQVSVSVGAISSSYVGSGITRRSSTDLSASGATVTAPAGYYSSSASKSVDSMTLPTSASASATSGYTSKATISRSTSDQYINIPTGYNSSGAYYKVNAVANGTEGTPTATKGSVSNHAISVTPSVTNSAGYISGGTHTGTAVSVSASELVSGTVNITASGNTDVTNYATASVASGSATASATKGTVSNHAVTVTPSVTRTAGYITAGSANGTAVTVSASELVSGSQTVTTNDTYDVTNLAELVVNVSGGGGSTMSVSESSVTPSSASSSISFTNLDGNPTSFVILCNETITPSSTVQVSMVVYDGTSLHAQTITNTNNAQVSYAGTGFSKTYSNGTLTVTATNAQFVAGSYSMTYSYGGSASNIHTADVQVGSGATSITFTSLDDEPAYWSCIFKSNFSTSNGYQRVIGVYADSTNDKYGQEMDSTSHWSQSHWSSSYNNGSLTITSQGTNAGGYFHQPGYYQLTYAIADASPYQKKTVTPTTSQQVVTADTGYDALSQVTVNAIPSSYVQPTSTVGATTYRASTSDQTIASGTYHSAQATIAAVTQTNLTAANIKSGTTISISNGQSNLWSVTGTYDGGGGGSSSIATATMSNSSNQAQSIDFTLPSGRTPIAFFCRLTSTITRSSNSRYYYCFDMRWDGSSSGGVAGNCFYMSSGQLTNITSGYSYSQSGTTFTLSSTGSRSTSPGSFYNGAYELVYIY